MTKAAFTMHTLQKLLEKKNLFIFLSKT